MIGKVVRAIILIPLGIVLVALALANRQVITVSFDPFSQTDPALSARLPLFALIVVLLIAGVVVGGAAAWLGQRRWRRAARIADADARRLRMELDATRQRDPAASVMRAGSAEPLRLRIPPPAA